MGHGARSNRIYQGATEKSKKEQGAKRDVKGAVKIGKKEPCQREQGAKTPPPNRASFMV